MSEKSEIGPLEQTFFQDNVFFSKIFISIKCVKMKLKMKLQIKLKICS